jgi:hypothetical protein
VNPKEFSLSEKDIEEIITTMIQMKAAHTMKTGRAPTGFVLGPREWYAFRLSAKTLTTSSFAREVSPSLSGISVYVKTTPGIDLLIHPDYASQFLGKD